MTEPGVTSTDTSTIVLFRNIPSNIPENELKEVFQTSGKVVDYQFLGNECIVTYDNSNSAQSTVMLNGVEMMTSTLKVEIIDETTKQQLLNRARNGSALLNATNAESESNSHNLNDPNKALINKTIKTNGPFNSKMNGNTNAKGEDDDISKAMALIQAMAQPQPDQLREVCALFCNYCVCFFFLKCLMVSLFFFFLTKKKGGGGRGGDIMKQIKNEQKSNQMADELSRTIYLGNLNPLVTEEHVKQFFADCGVATHVKILGNIQH
ncbi:hypothetical protein RFI_20072, partial [Reticulomyxa filosa]